MATYRVPQQTTIDEPIIGNFTLKQAACIAIFASLGYMVLKSALWVPLRVFLTGLFMAIGFALATIRIQGRGLGDWVASYIVFLFTPKTRKFNPEVALNFAFPIDTKRPRWVMWVAPLVRLAQAKQKTRTPRMQITPPPQTIPVFKEDPAYLNDTSEQTKALIKSFWPQRWQKMLEKSSFLEEAETGRLLTALEQVLFDELMEEETGGER